MHHPDPPSRLRPAYEALALELQRRGHTDVFGLMGDDTALFVATLDAIGVRFHAARHENTAIAMAEGYAAASGRLGIAVIGRGPATANALHGAMYAHRAGSRVLLIFGAAPMAPSNAPDSKAFNTLGVFEAAGLRTLVAGHAAGVLDSLDSAIRASEQPGCACLLLPADVQTALLPYPMDLDHQKPAGAPATPARQPARRAALDAAAAILNRARRPLIVVVLDDCAYGAELHYLRLRQMPVARSLFADFDFAPLAQSIGFQAWTVRSVLELRDLAPLLAQPDGPILIDSKINADVAAGYHTEVLAHTQSRR
jgi:acetolactate synthase I/II/III large subunit